MVEPKPYRVLVTGSRTWPEIEKVKKVITATYTRLSKYCLGELILVHGTARGVDEAASKAWLEAGGTVEPHPADWDTYHKQAGFVRNKEMVDSGIDLCLAFIHNNSRGASQCLRLVEREGIAALVVRINDDEPTPNS